MTVDLRLVRHALALAKHRNFARAAAALHLSQPTLSRNIASLERALGVRLFDRNTAGVEPTSFGRLVLERGEQLLAGEADLLREIKLQAGIEVGTLAVAAGPYPFEISVGTAMTRLISAHPRLRAQVSVVDPREVLQFVLNGRVDVGVTDARFISRDERFSIEPLPEHAIHLACRRGHPLAGKRRLTRSAVFAYPLASPLVPANASSVVGSAGRMSGAFDAMSGDFLPAITVNSFGIARQIAAGTDALVPGAAPMLAADLEAGRLVTLDYHSPEMRTNYAITTLRGRTPSPVALAFMEILREVEADVAASEASSEQAGARKKPRPRRTRRLAAAPSA
jgi:DNA-binding transcriptional LysR family regulator